MKICVTGGTGYVGKYLSLYLKNNGHDTSVVVRSKKSEDIAKELGLKFISGDLNNLDDLIPKLKSFDAVIHCAFDYTIDFKKSVDLDRIFLNSLLNQDNLKLKHFIYTSSAYALHNDKNEIYDESIDISLLPYSDKWIFRHEKIVNDACSDKLKTSVIRAGMVYGGFGGSMDSFFDEAHRTRKLFMPGDGNNFWSFIHVNDLARMYALILQNNSTGIFHGIDSKPLKVIDVFNAINSTCTNQSEIIGLSGETAINKYGLYYNTYLSDIRVISRRKSEINWVLEKTDFITSIQTVFDEWKNKTINL
jgi:nucleoside-diphosphate-sugar epimerase